jgi:hypothetical protein
LARLMVRRELSMNACLSKMIYGFRTIPLAQLVRDHPKCFPDLRQPLVFLPHPRVNILRGAHQSVSRPKTYEKKKQDESGQVSNHDIRRIQ